MPTFIALIHKDDDSDYGVSFPDFPGCVTVGSTLDEALTFHVDGMKEDGDPVPLPSNFEMILRDLEHRNGHAFLIELSA